MMLQTVFFSYSIYGKSLLAVSRVKKEERLRYQKVIEIVWQHSLARLRRCGGSLGGHQTSGSEVLGSNPASPTMILRQKKI